MNFEYDIIVVGGGHAGVEASNAAAKMGMKTLLCTLNKKMIGNMPCNPHIGGSAKGVVVREIDALGGIMGKAADVKPLQIKMLNTSKGPSVQCLRSQQDKIGYPATVQKMLDSIENLTIKECEVIGLLHNDDTVYGVITKDKEEITSKAVIITTGTYMDSRIISGTDIKVEGPDGEKASIGFSKSLAEMGIEIFRLKTGTPQRLKKSTIDFSKGEIQLGTPGYLAFSYETNRYISLEEQLPCYLIYTSPETLKIINNNLKLSGLFNGTITSNGPRYCPSIESKIVRFADKQRHQLFLEPEFENGESIYLQGFSTAMPHDIQEKMVHSLPGLENAEILKYAYQIEYDAIKPLQFDYTLNVRKYKGLYGAGQICGTSGYEEAGGLGIMAGINAALWIQGKEPFVLKRNEAYIGVMIDDLVSKGTEEPYRLLSSRAEYRLLLRHDNADLRLTKYGYKFGTIDENRYQLFTSKYNKLNNIIHTLETVNINNREGLKTLFNTKGIEYTGVGFKGSEIVKRPEFTFNEIKPLIDDIKDISLTDEEVLSLETEIKYEGYIKKQIKDAENLLKQEETLLPTDVDYSLVDGLRLEARQKLNAVKPHNIGQASRIPGVNPADIAILLMRMKHGGKL